MNWDQVMAYYNEVAQTHHEEFQAELSLRREQIDNQYRLGLMNARTEAARLELDKWYRHEQIKLAKDQLQLDKQKFGFQIIEEFAKMGGPADYVQASNLARGVAGNAQYAEFMRKLMSGEGSPAFQAPAGVPTKQSPQTLVAQLGVNGGQYVAPAAAGATTAPPASTTGAAPTVAPAVAGLSQQAAQQVAEQQPGATTTGATSSGATMVLTPPGPTPTAPTPITAGQVGKKFKAERPEGDRKKKGRGDSQVRTGRIWNPTAADVTQPANPAVNLYADQQARAAYLTQMAQNLLARGPGSLPPGSLEALDENELKLLGSAVREAGGDPGSLLSGYKASRIWQGSATAA